MHRCVPEMIGTGEDKRPQEQAVAACLNIWREAHPGSAPPPKNAIALKQDAPDAEEGESRDDYIDRCGSEMTADDDTLDESDAQEACELAWEEANGNQDRQVRDRDGMIYKTHTTAGHGTEFVLSDATVDRMGDVIEPRGWRLDSFFGNPVALFNHHKDWPIGTWVNIRLSDKDLRAEFAPADKTVRRRSARIDEICTLVEAGILRAVSVGFQPLRQEPLDPNKKWGGQRFLEQMLLETSVVTVPANPNALAVAKGLVSASTLRAVFGKHAGNDIVRRVYSRGESAGMRGATKSTGEHAEAKRSNHGRNIMLLSQRIQ